ncbi:MAG TPA: ABC transporter permease [Erysipelothrix sp.]|nr:ABC transporter permease [Erysipelothrix sp.]
MNYLINRFDDIVSALAQHTQIVLITLFFSIILASMLTYFSIKNRTVQLLLKAFLAMLFSIPSLAFFGLMIPFTGLGRTSAIIVLVIYQQYILLNNFLDGLMNIEPSIIEAAQGMGMSNHQILFKIQLPLAKDSIFTGIRLSILSTIGITVIAASINAGGLGRIIFEGLNTRNNDKIIVGSILAGLLAILVNAILKLIEKRFKTKSDS